MHVHMHSHTHAYQTHTHLCMQKDMHAHTRQICADRQTDTQSSCQRAVYWSFGSQRHDSQTCRRPSLPNKPTHHFIMLMESQEYWHGTKLGDVSKITEDGLIIETHHVFQIQHCLFPCLAPRGLFSRKQRPSSQSAPGWKLFGKVPLKESPTKNARTIQQEYEVRQGRASAGSSPTQHAMGRSRKNLEFEPLSTTALILEDRPANLPAKSLEEAQRHRQQYNEIVAEAKKRELKEAQKRQKQVRERLKQEESIANAMVVWNNDILPHWDSMRASRRARDLWWQGLPPNVRGRVWSLAIGNELNITPELYEIFLSRAMEKWRTFDESPSESDADASLADRESSLELIKLDISRTFPSLYIFQKDGPYHNLLHSILGAYTCYRPDIGYVQGMSFIAAVLILNMEEADAFISFANLINKPCQMTFFRVDHELMLKYFGAFEVFFEENLPRLFNHFLSSNLTPDLYLIDWIFSLYTKPFPLDVACRVWDVFCRDGEEFLFRVGLGILRLYQDILLQMDFIHIGLHSRLLPPLLQSFSCGLGC
uniref:TBC1 domain family member 12-like n=1 Tax=Gadus morhua TaxID=8049 RepID=A0A8C5D344_GADMO